MVTNQANIKIMFMIPASANHWKSFYLAALLRVNNAQPLAAICRLTAPELTPLDCFTNIARKCGTLFIHGCPKQIGTTVVPSTSSDLWNPF